MRRQMHGWPASYAQPMPQRYCACFAQMGDVPATWADASLLQSLTGFKPQTDVKTGIKQFVAWFRDYYGK